MEYLVSDEAQGLYARANYEYPVKAGVELDPVVASFGEMQVDPLPLTEVVRHRREASVLVDKVGFDNSGLGDVVGRPCWRDAGPTASCCALAQFGAAARRAMAAGGGGTRGAGAGAAAG